MSGLLVIISAPSGGGKNAVIEELLKKIPGSAHFVTTTTRTPRPGEHEGEDYYYLARTAFEEKIAKGEFVEYNEFNGNLYGTDRKRLTESLDSHTVLFAALDVNGKKHFDEERIPHTAIFLRPDSIQTLRERVRRRGSLTEAQMDERMKIAESEIAASGSYDYCIVNREGNMNEAVREIVGILDKKQSR